MACSILMEVGKFDFAESLYTCCALEQYFTDPFLFAWKRMHMKDHQTKMKHVPPESFTYLHWLHCWGAADTKLRNQAEYFSPIWVIDINHAVTYWTASADIVVCGFASGRGQGTDSDTVIAPMAPDFSSKALLNLFVWSFMWMKHEVLCKSKFSFFCGQAFQLEIKTQQYTPFPLLHTFHIHIYFVTILILSPLLLIY